MAVSVFALLVLATSVTAEIVQFNPCPGIQNACTVHEVRVEPCKESPDACKIKLGKTATISFDYTADFDATTAKNSVESTFGGQPVRLQSLDEDGCKNTQCPIVKGQRSTYNYSLRVLRIWPRGTFPTIWKLWNPENESQICCLQTEIYLKL